MKIERITSRKNPLVQWASSLHEKKYREQENSFLVEGFKLFEEAVKNGCEVTHIFLEEGKHDRYYTAVCDILAANGKADVPIYILAESCFEKISTEKAPQGVITAIKSLDKSKNIIKIYKVDEFVSSTDFCMLLCSLRDPSNMGAILRSASAFGVDTIILTDDCVDPYQSKVARAAMGALFRVRILYTDAPADLVSVFREKGRRVFAAELRDGARSVCDLALTSRDILLIGNEGHGIPLDVSNACDASVYIPIGVTTESLNASVAASILLWEQSKH